jgi:hypothetical protein
MKNIDDSIKLEWNVFIYDINERQIELFNVFNHGRYRQEIIKLLNHKHDFRLKEFTEKVKRQRCITIGASVNGRF